MQNRPIVHRGSMLTDYIAINDNDFRVHKKIKKYKKYRGINRFTNNLSNVIDYTIIEKLGEGSMGIAYKLTDQNDSSIIKKVYKNMDPKDSRFSNWHKRFMNEVSILAELVGEAH